MDVLPIYMSEYHMHAVPGKTRKKMPLDPLELELHMVASCCVGAEN